MFESSVFAASGDNASTEMILGKWNLTGRTCTSNTVTSDSFKVGQDKINVLLNKDQSFLLGKTVAGCKVDTKGTYEVDRMKVTFTVASRQGCKDTSPQSIVETYSMYVAHLESKLLVLIASGEKAAACPVGDALVLNYER